MDFFLLKVLVSFLCISDGRYWCPVYCAVMTLPSNCMPLLWMVYTKAANGATGDLATKIYKK